MGNDSSRPSASQADAVAEARTLGVALLGSRPCLLALVPRRSEHATCTDCRRSRLPCLLRCAPVLAAQILLEWAHQSFVSSCPYPFLKCGPWRATCFAKNSPDDGSIRLS